MAKFFSWRNSAYMVSMYAMVPPSLHCIECEDVDAIDMKLNEVYGISTTANDIKTVPNEVYGLVASGNHHGVSSCQRWL